MGIEKKFIDDSLLRQRVAEFVSKELKFAGIGNIEVRRTPMVTKVNVECLSPGKVIGRKGKSIQTLTDAIKVKFNIDNPQINVVEIGDMYLNPKLVAEKAAKYIEMKRSYRYVAHTFIDEIMKRGAIGVEIRIAGKLAGKGGRAKSFRAMKGFVPKAGEIAKENVKIANSVAITPYGIIGITVRIVPPESKLNIEQDDKGGD
ncbi:30S ribosomal protein S3 [Candidatus Micrarchaeota archaeon]|nr:30S ribosomal protein S3 [Candidatus Micrarchaeota archaeon]